jgi:3-oxoadipate enol-lactonase
MREFWFESEGGRLFAVEDGSGHAIVMLHGGMANHQAAVPLIAPLGSRYRVIAPDLRGSGKSWSGAPLTFDRLADDVEALLDHIGVQRAVIGGVSGGAGVAVRFALRHPGRTAALLVIMPVFAGDDRGYTDQQKTIFATMDALASRALIEGVQVMRSLYANLPPHIRERALAALQDCDAASVVATSHFIVSGVQPFASAAELRSVQAPTLLVRGNDPIHPPEVSDVYAASIPNCTVVPAPTEALAGAIGAFCDQCLDPETGPKGVPPVR